MFNSKERIERAEKSYIENGGYQKLIEDLVKENLIEFLYEANTYILARRNSQRYICFHKAAMNKYHRICYSFIIPIQALNILNGPDDEGNGKAFLCNVEFDRAYAELKNCCLYFKHDIIIPFVNRGINKKIKEKIEELKKADAAREHRDSASAQQG